jgi:hypothetical protein
MEGNESAMEGFVKVNNTLVNASRILAVQHSPELDQGVRYSPEHYTAVFDTGQQIRLTPEEGSSLVSHCEGTIAMTSEIAK